MFDEVWKEHNRHGSIERKTSCLKSLSLIFLHHFIATTMQCRSRSYNKVTAEDLWMLDMVAKGESINLNGYIMDKTLHLKISFSKKKPSTNKKITVPYVTIITKMGKKMS